MPKPKLSHALRKPPVAPPKPKAIQVHDKLYKENNLNFAKKMYTQKSKVKKMKLLKPIISQ